MNETTAPLDDSKPSADTATDATPEASFKQGTSELVLELDDNPGVLVGLIGGFQHLLAMFVPIMTPAMILGTMYGLPLEMTSYLISVSLISSGIGTLVQSSGWRGLGTGLLSVVGTSFTFIPVLLFTFAMYDGTLPKEEIIAIVTGLTIVGGLTMMIISRMVFIFDRVFPPLVNGVILALVGFSLCKVGMTDLCGGYAAKAAGTFGQVQHIALGGSVLLLIVVLNCSRNPFVRTSSVLVGLLAGYVISCFLGIVDFSHLGEVSTFNLPVPLKYGVSFSSSAFVLMFLCIVLASAEAVGDVSATSVLSRQPISGPIFMKRLTGGILVSGGACVVSGLLNSFPLSLYSQNNGVIQVTGIASKHIGKFVGGLLILLGLFPMFGGMLAVMPAPVLGGATLLLFAMVGAAGVKVVAMQELDRRAMLILALTLGVGLGVELVPEVTSSMPSILKGIADSPISAGGSVAIVANLLIPHLRKAS